MTGRGNSIQWLTCLMVLLWRHVGSVPSIHGTADMPGDVTVAGLFLVQEATGSGCGSIQMQSVKEIEAVKWVFKSLNHKHFIPGVKIGFKAFATCGATEKALKHTNAIIVEHSISQRTDCSGTNYVGIIGPTSSAEAIAVSRLLSSLPKSSSLIEIAYSATSPSLSDKSMYQNFFRVVPTDNTKIKAMVELMKDLKWTYIAVYYGNDTYGVEGATELISLAQKRGICSPIVQGFNTTSTTQEIKEFFASSLRNLKDSYGNRIGGVILFAASSLAQLLAEAVDMLRGENLPLPVFIFSEAVTVGRHFRYGNGSTIDSVKGSFCLNPSQITVDEFNQHWKNIYQDTQYLVQESQTNPWLTDLFEGITNCSLISNTCSPLSNDDLEKNNLHTDYVQYAIQAALVMAWAIKHTWENLCDGQETGLCSKFCTDAGKTIMETATEADIHFDFSQYFHIKSFSDQVTLMFDENNDVAIPSTEPSYEVQNFRSCLENDTDFCLVKVGTYFGTNEDPKNEFKLEKTLVRDYSKGQNELLWVNIRKAQCPDGQTCEDCTLGNKLIGIYHIPGDMYIIGIAPLHNKGKTPLSCGLLRPHDGFDIAEAIVYAVTESKERNMDIPQGKIGVIIIDSCDDPISVQQKILSLHRFGLETESGETIDINDKVIGYIGAFGSSISISIADIVTRLGYVQISYGSASPLLSNRYLYPYFLRITSSSDDQAPVILDVIKKLGSDYIQLLYSEEAYGEGGRDSITREAENYEICIAQVLSVSDGDADYYSGIIDKLREFKEARVIVLFLREHVVPKLLKVIVEGEFMFIGSEGWGKGDILKDTPKAKGSITVAQVLPIHDGFTKHINNLSPKNNADNPWLAPYMEMRLKCSYQWTFDKSIHSEQCSEDARLDQGIDYLPDAWSPFAIHTIYALLLGANIALEQFCGSTTSLCKNYSDNPLLLAKILKTVRLDLTKTGTPEFVFNKNGDGSVGYMLYNVKEGHDGTLEYGSPIGRWINGRSEYFWKDQLVYPDDTPMTSVCDDGDICSKCFGNSEPIIDKELPFVVGIVVLSVLLVLALVVIAVIIWKKRKRELPDDIYLHVVHNASKENTYIE